jgi:hypothetical protein
VSRDGNRLRIAESVNRTRNGTCVNRVVLVLRKERAMYGGTSWALSPERASANMKMGKNLGQNTRGHRYITVPDREYVNHDTLGAGTSGPSNSVKYTSKQLRV